MRAARRLFTVAATGALLLTGLAAPTVAAAAPGPVYVALGDSYTSGPLIPPQKDALTCLRSGQNYPSKVRPHIGASVFRDASCSGATTRDFTNPQKGTVTGTNPPQYNALSADTTLVTVGIGGNDVGLVGLATSCLNFAPPPVGKSCAAKYTAGGVDQYSQRIQAFAPTYATVISQIQARAPQAKIVFVGYPFAIRPGGCFPVQPLLAPDATYIQAKIDELNAAMKQQAESNGAEYVDIRTQSVGHDACALPGPCWTEGLVPLQVAAPLHPNVFGMRKAADAVLAHLAAGGLPTS